MSDILSDRSIDCLLAGPGLACLDWPEVERSEVNAYAMHATIWIWIWIWIERLQNLFVICRCAFGLLVQL